MLPQATCPHLVNAGQYSKDEILSKKKLNRCDSCGEPGPYLWLCLHKNCLYSGCGEGAHDDSTKHWETNNEHCLQMHLSTYRVWCYNCKSEVMLKFDLHNHQKMNSCFYLSEYSNPRGLTGLKNIGNTCYMNAAIQALSNTPPLTIYFLKCSNIIKSEKKGSLSRCYSRLMEEMWHEKTPSFVVPSSILQEMRKSHPSFRGCHQQDTQEFLRCFMDQLHKDLKDPIYEFHMLHHNSDCDTNPSTCIQDDYEAEISDDSQSDGYETCDSYPSVESLYQSRKSIENGEKPSEGSACKKFRQSYDHDNSGGGGESAAASVSPASHDSSESVPSWAGAGEDGDGECFCDALSESMSDGSVGSLSPPRNRAIKPALHIPSFVKMQSNVSTITDLPRKRKILDYRSIISDVFDGKILSNVQCLTCERVSSSKETFQDLSLTIPNKDHLNTLHQRGGGAVSEVSQQGWISWMWGFIKGMFWGPEVSLHDCLAAFFSADELKGDNMYSCEKCKKLRNGVKYSKVLKLPEILCIHLKRFRHELMISKISSFVSFPLEGLDMSPFLHKDCPDKVSSYNLIAVICHHGNMGCGHYTTYALNSDSKLWYEFDDQCISEVTSDVVQNCEAYVLFYCKQNREMDQKRDHLKNLLQCSVQDQSLMTFYISKRWITRFQTFAEPGPIDNSDFLCQHNAVIPDKFNRVNEFCCQVSQGVYEYLYQSFGGTSICTKLHACHICERELNAIHARQRAERNMYMKLDEEWQSDLQGSQASFAISTAWFKTWETFIQGRDNEIPGPVDNTSICISQNNIFSAKIGSAYYPISENTWKFFVCTYGGGPEILLNEGIKNVDLTNYVGDVGEKTNSRSSSISRVRAVSAENINEVGKHSVLSTTKIVPGRNIPRASSNESGYFSVTSNNLPFEVEYSRVWNNSQNCLQNVSLGMNNSSHIAHPGNETDSQKLVRVHQDQLIN